jgi:MoaA/NifB/PqqE/SkfB family radical SAM enzyme
MTCSTPETRFANIPQVMIEIYSYCNRDCPFCPRYGDRSGVRKDIEGHPIHMRMPTEKVHWLIDELYQGGYRGVVTFHHLSEPLLDKRYPDFARYATDRGMKVQDSTNGDVLKANPQLCEELDGIVDRFHIGLYDYETHEQKIKEMEFWTQRFKKTKVIFSTPYENINVRQYSEVYQWMHKDERIIDLPCQYRLNMLFVCYTGEAHLCCQDDYGAFSLGNVFDVGIDHVLFSQRRKEIVSTLAEPGGRRKFDLCSKCYLGKLPGHLQTEDDRRADDKIKELHGLFEAGAVTLHEMVKMSDAARQQLPISEFEKKPIGWNG